MTIEEIRQQLHEEIKQQRYIVRHSHPVVTSARKHLNVAKNETVNQQKLIERAALLSKIKANASVNAQRSTRWMQEEF